jgi:hypothetical protein
MVHTAQRRQLEFTQPKRPLDLANIAASLHLIEGESFVVIGDSYYLRATPSYRCAKRQRHSSVSECSFLRGSTRSSYVVCGALHCSPGGGGEAIGAAKQANQMRGIGVTYALGDGVELLVGGL